MGLMEPIKRAKAAQTIDRQQEVRTQLKGGGGNYESYNRIDYSE